MESEKRIASINYPVKVKRLSDGRDQFLDADGVWLISHDIADALNAAREDAERLEAERDGAYLERNRLVSLLAALYPSVRTKTAIEGWDPAWNNCVYLTLPTGQASWHYHDREAHLFAHVPEGGCDWDGHSTDEKYRRVCAEAMDVEPIAALRRDAERYQALRAILQGDALVPDVRHWVSRALAEVEHAMDDCTAEQIDEAIDAARAAQNGGE